MRQSEDIWLEIINCNEYASSMYETTIIVNNYQLHCAEFDTGTPDWVECIFEFCDGDVGNGCMEEITTTYHIFTGKKSDGLLCGATQIGDGIPSSHRYEAMGVNHAEETNSSSETTLDGNDEMRDVFDLIWDRDPFDFFHTDRR